MTPALHDELVAVDGHALLDLGAQLLAQLLRVDTAVIEHADGFGHRFEQQAERGIDRAPADGRSPLDGAVVDRDDLLVDQELPRSDQRPETSAHLRFPWSLPVASRSIGRAAQVKLETCAPRPTEPTLDRLSQAIRGAPRVELDLPQGVVESGDVDVEIRRRSPRSRDPDRRRRRRPVGTLHHIAPMHIHGIQTLERTEIHQGVEAPRNARQRLGLQRFELVQAIGEILSRQKLSQLLDRVEVVDQGEGQLHRKKPLQTTVDFCRGQRVDAEAVERHLGRDLVRFDRHETRDLGAKPAFDLRSARLRPLSDMSLAHAEVPSRRIEECARSIRVPAR